MLCKIHCLFLRFYYVVKVLPPPPPKKQSVFIRIIEIEINVCGGGDLKPGLPEQYNCLLDAFFLQKFLMICVEK
jgi:hypothetical protein